MKIFIDAGHNNSGWNTGATGNGLREQDITFAVSSILGGILSAQGFDIKLSRPTKETNLGTNNASSINVRYTMANAWGADIFISIHCNAGGGTGTETLYYKPDSLLLATELQMAFTGMMGLKSRGVKYRNDIGVIMHTKMPAVLLELAFIDTYADAQVLAYRQEEMAQAIAQGLYNYLGFTPIEKEEVEVVDKMALLYHGQPVEVNRILKDGHNFVKLRDLEKLGMNVDYDTEQNLPTVEEQVEVIDVEVNGKVYPAERFLINGHNYLKLRDMGDMGFTVGYENGMPTINNK